MIKNEEPSSSIFEAKIGSNIAIREASDALGP